MPKKPNYKKAIRESMNLLAVHGITQPPIDVRAIAEREGIEIQLEELEDNVSGFLVQAPNRTVIGVNTHHHRNRQRFTIAHELGHRQLHPTEPTVYIDDLMVHFRGEDITAPLTATELEANTFAASLLMPEEFLRRDFAGKRVDAQDEAAVRQVARRYEVSVQALTIRLVDLGMLSGTMGRLQSS